MAIQYYSSLVFLLCLTVPSSAFFFGGGGGSGCGCSAAPACPVAPACAPVSSGCGGGGYPQQSYSAPGPVFGQQQSAGFGGSGYVQSGGFAPQQQQQQQFIPQQQQQQGSSYVAAPQSGGYAPQQQQQQPQGGSYAAPQQQSFVPPPPAPAPASYQVQPSGVQYEGVPHAAAGETLREVEEEEESATETAVAAASDAAPEEADPIDIKSIKLSDDPECNSEELKTIIKENIEEDLNSAKRLIQLASEAKFGGRFDVICSTNDFSYVTNTELYCQATHKDISCYAYRQL